MTDSLIIAITLGALLLAAIVLLIVMLVRINRLQAANSATDLQTLERLLQNLDGSLVNGLSESRKELREVSAENRRELQQAFTTLQDSLLSRIAENASLQTGKIDGFQAALNELSEKLINNSNDFRHSVTLSFQASSEVLSKKQDEFRDKTAQKLEAFETGIKNDALTNRQELNNGLKSFETRFSEGIREFNEQLRLRFADLNKQQVEANQQARTGIGEIRQTIENQLKAIREDNTLQLNEMRKTVDEKLHDTLEKRLGESFKQVSDRLEQVHKGLGEMQTLAVGVGDLKKVLSNVKTRGILGEYQLGNILEQILTPDQYAVNVATKQGSRENVEYAIKLPGKSDEKTVWLPIDSKFPLENYQTLLAALEEGNLPGIDIAQKQLLKSIESFAKDISGKYIDPPHTTDFAIMFLPIESLFAEVLRHPEMFERLQRTYRITITGPTTLSALLNSLNMGFRTLAVQKRSSEVWKVLAEVKTEFIKYSEQLATVHKHITSASTTLETLQTTRTKAMERKLRNVDGLEADSPPLELPDDGGNA
ncbi:MAG: DNA recombination protein RmuC [Methylococcales bacterium]|nr:DNA recombination protein RmuC [Methylococcales bacterium]